MDNIRIGKDIKIRWKVNLNDRPVTADDNLTLIMVNPRLHIKKLDYIIEDGTVISTFRGNELLYTGKYKLTLWFNYGEENQTALDETEAFRLIKFSDREYEDTEVTETTVDLTGKVTISGASAYEIWLANGNSGTQQDFLDSLKGDKGDKGLDGKDGADGKDGENGLDGIFYRGIINITSSSAKTTIDTIANELKRNDVALCFIGDSNGTLPSTETYVTVNSNLLQALNYFTATEPFDINVGDILIISKIRYLLVDRTILKVVPLNDAKINTNGVMTPWDKVRVNKVDGIEWTVNNNRDRLNNLFPSVWLSNMDDCLDNGVYPWCTLGRPSGSTGAFTCVSKKTTTADSNGFYTVEQTAYGREGELGQIYKRLVFVNGNTKDYLEWVKIGG